MELCHTSLFICFKSMKWRQFSSKHSLERALNSLQSNWLFQPKFSISRDSALANILRICSDITHDSQYFRNVDFSCPMWQLKKCYAVLLLLLLLVKVTFYRFSQDDKPQHVTPEFPSAPHILTGVCVVSTVTPHSVSTIANNLWEIFFILNWVE